MLTMASYMKSLTLTWWQLLCILMMGHLSLVHGVLAGCAGGPLRLLSSTSCHLYIEISCQLPRASNSTVLYSRNWTFYISYNSLTNFFSVTLCIYYKFI
jgi:hypothetical protein